MTLVPAQEPGNLRSHLTAQGSALGMTDFQLAEGVAEVARSAWLQRWNLPPGRHSHLLLLTHVGCRVIFTPDGARLHGPRSRAVTVNTSGSGWKVGVRLLPAAALLLTHTQPRLLIDRNVACPDCPADAVREAMEEPDSSTGVLGEILCSWLRPKADSLPEAGLLVNRICRAAETDPAIQSVQSLAERFSLSPRALRRLVTHHTGVHPHWLIERRRLQQALAALYDEPDTPLAALAIDLGYTDQAHFSHSFRQVIGLTPGKLRRAWLK